MKIKGYKPSLVPIGSKKWGWVCAVWFSDSFFADVKIVSADHKPFYSPEEATADMEEMIKKFGVTKKTYKAW